MVVLQVHLYCNSDTSAETLEFGANDTMRMVVDPNNILGDTMSPSTSGGAVLPQIHMGFAMPLTATTMATPAILQKTSAGPSATPAVPFLR